MSELRVNTIQNTSSVSAITIGASGRILYPATPTFCVRGVSNTTGSSVNRVFLFDTSINVNIGSHYNSTNGRFTAPVAGIYYITYHIFGEGTTQRHLAQLNVNGSIYSETTNENSAGAGSGYSNLSNAILVYLNVNDYIEVAGNVKLIDNSAGYNFFSGYLVGS